MGRLKYIAILNYLLIVTFLILFSCNDNLKYFDNNVLKNCTQLIKIDDELICIIEVESGEKPSEIRLYKDLKLKSILQSSPFFTYGFRIRDLNSKENIINIDYYVEKREKKSFKNNIISYIGKNKVLGEYHIKYNKVEIYSTGIDKRISFDSLSIKEDSFIIFFLNKKVVDNVYLIDLSFNQNSITYKKLKIDMNGNNFSITILEPLNKVTYEDFRKSVMNFIKLK